MSIQVFGDLWNPTTGCTKISPGCRGCYAETMAKRLKGMRQPRYKNGFNLTLHPELVDLPRIRKKAKTFFVDSMSDLFHKAVPLDFIQSVFKTMNDCPQHTFQVLTKRSDILLQHAPSLTWSPNIWMGVSVENDAYAFRVDDLRKVPAALRFLSIEPLIGPIPSLNLDDIHWVVCGGESGPTWRTMDLDWVREIRDKCIAAQVPFFFKQIAALHPERLGRMLDGEEWSEFPTQLATPTAASPTAPLPLRALRAVPPYVPYAPKRVFVNEKAKGHFRTDEYLRRIRKANPQVEVTDYSGRFEYPDGLSADQKFHFMKESVLIAERTVPFFETFPSPGNCVESINTMVKLTWQCVGLCRYCYLMLTEPHEHYFYTNLEKFEDELATSLYAHRIILTVWQLASESQGRTFPKIPFHLRNAAEEIRADCVANGIRSDQDAVAFLRQHLSGSILDGLRRHWQKELPANTCPYDSRSFERPKEEIAARFAEAAQKPFEIHPTEYSDIGAIDHLTGHLDYLMNQLSRYPEVRMKVRTKFPHIDGLLRHDGQGRVRVAVNFNTPYAIQEFESNAPSLEERIETLVKIQQAKGYIPEAVIEPIIPYPGHRQDYAELVQKILARVDKSRLSTFIVGSVRYKVTEGSLIRVSERNFPNSGLFATEQMLQKAERGDGRKRYEVAWRVSIYKELIDIIRREAPNTKIRLAAETPEVWKELGMDIDAYMSRDIPQVGSKGVPTMSQSQPPSQIEPEATEPEPSVVKPARSIRLESALAGIGATQGNRSESISDLEALERIDAEMQSMGDLRSEIASKWDRLFAANVKNALMSDFFTPVKIVGWIADISQPQPIRPRNVPGGEITRGCHVSIVDEEREILRTLLVPLTSTTKELYAIKKQNMRVVFCGAIVPVNSNRTSHNRFFLWEIVPSWTAEDLIGIDPTANVKDLVELYEKHQKKPLGIFNYIKQELQDQLGIKGLEKLPELERSVEVMILQAMSDGVNVSPLYSNRIHTLVMGPPGQGKKFLMEIAKVLNPVSGQASTTGGKVNTAGLVGNVIRQGKGSISVPGLIPMNSGGVLAFQDFHQLKAGRQTILAAMSEAMEDGRVTDSTSAKASHEAVTAFHVDMNKLSQVSGIANISPFKDVNIPSNLISRFDYIVDLPADLDRQLKTLRQSFSGSRILSSYPSTRKESTRTWQRSLQRITAYLRTHWREVEIPAEVNQYILDQVKKEFGLQKSGIPSGQTKMIQDNITRVSRSVHKFVKAITCVDGQVIVTKQHVDMAMTYVADKIRFLQSLGSEEGSSGSDPRTAAAKKRREAILAKMPTKFTTGEYRKQLPKSMAPKAVSMQATRDLEDLRRAGAITKESHGKWSKTQKPKVKAKPLKTARKQRAKKTTRVSKRNR